MADVREKIQNAHRHLCERSEGFFLISTMDEASSFLFDHWPGHESEAWTDAMYQCAGVGDSANASTAFIAAVVGAGMRIDATVLLN